MENVKIKVDTAELDEAIKKTERLIGLLKEANSLISELASSEVKSSVKIQC